MTARRYEMGRPVFDNRANASSLGEGKRVGKTSTTPPPMADASSDDTPIQQEAPKAHAKVVRRPPPSIPPDAPGTIEAGMASAAVTAALEDGARTSAAVPDTQPVVDTPEAPTSEKSVAMVKPPAGADEEITDTSNMRKFLLKQMVRAAKGEITTETVKNIVAISQQVYNATSLELKAAMILKSGDKSIRALELVSPQDADE